MNHSPAPLPGLAPVVEATGAPGRAFSRRSGWLLVLAAVGINLSLLWDFSWESTIGIDLVWAPPHATYVAAALAALAGLGLVSTTARGSGVRLRPFQAPLGGWLALWGALAFGCAVLFDRWWQSAYGLSAGIWHPPQILKAVAFFAIVTGAWLLCLNWQNQPIREHSRDGALLFAGSGGLVLALITVVTLTWNYPNRQHSAPFYKLACGTYPIVLVALAMAGKLRWPATAGALVYTALIAAMVWLLPLFPAKPQVAPIYNPLDHMMPPPFPLLLVLPAAALDALFRKLSWPAYRATPWLQAGAAGLAFFIIFIAVQWAFAEFLLSDLADNRVFAGGGRHWPFFLKIDPAARVEFWRTDELNLIPTLAAAGFAMGAARIGLWIGRWMTRVQR